MKIAMLFPGYGSQFVGMAKDLYDNNRVVQDHFEEASNCLDTNFVKLCFASSDSELASIENAYVSIFLVSSAIYALLKSEGIEPSAVAGYNTGEYAAYYAAGGLNFPDGLYLLKKYASFYQELLNTVDVQVIEVMGIPSRQLEDICFKVNAYAKNLVSIAIYKTATDHLVVGDSDSLEQLRDLLAQEEGATISDASIEVGLHSPLMNPVVNQFKIYLEKVDCRNVSVPLYSCSDAHPIERGSQICEHIVRHINAPIRWAQVMAALASYDLLVEVGPGSMLSNLVKKVYPKKQTIAINKRADIDELARLIANNTTDQES
jgi:[acyl-carrier-protein] S-malonyltransferase